MTSWIAPNGLHTPSNNSGAQKQSGTKVNDPSSPYMALIQTQWETQKSTQTHTRTHTHTHTHTYSHTHTQTHTHTHTHTQTHTHTEMQKSSMIPVICHLHWLIACFVQLSYPSSWRALDRVLNVALNQRPNNCLDYTSMLGDPFSRTAQWSLVQCNAPNYCKVNMCYDNFFVFVYTNIVFCGWTFSKGIFFFFIFVGPPNGPLDYFNWP